MNATYLLAMGSFSLALVTPSGQSSRGTVQLEASDCTQYTQTFSSDFTPAYAVQHATVPLTAGVLEIDPQANGGVRIEKGAGGAYAITACISAGAASREDAQRAVDGVRLLTDGGRVRVVNNDETARRWNVQLIVEAPAGAQINVQTQNGPIGISGADGRISARAQNGPISVRDASGQITASAKNGPISVSGSRGEFDLETENGPITVSLQGSRWEGRLDARAKNGPLTVRVPDQYSSGVEISSSGSSPWSCRGGNACANVTDDREWNRSPRTVKIGSDPVVVRISTVNGPVSIDNR